MCTQLLSQSARMVSHRKGGGSSGGEKTSSSSSSGSIHTQSISDSGFSKQATSDVNGGGAAETVPFGQLIAGHPQGRGTVDHVIGTGSTYGGGYPVCVAIGSAATYINNSEVYTRPYTTSPPGGVKTYAATILDSATLHIVVDNEIGTSLIADDTSNCSSVISVSTSNVPISTCKPLTDVSDASRIHSRSFGQSEAARGTKLSSELKRCEDKIAKLTEMESGVKKKWGIPQDADSTHVRQELHRTKSHPSTRDDVELLNGLQQAHLELGRIIDRLNFPTELQIPSISTDCAGAGLVDTSQFFALIVGIDRYPCSPLRGCVSDARLMEKYLAEHLRVPKNRIQLLLGPNEHTTADDAMKPSRANIINALLSLATNDEIQRDDNIIIYFAGHGSYYPPSEDDDTYGFIETLCPIDRDIMDENGKPIPDISDREFNVILSRIAEVKGQRITVILDCCHAGGASRTMRVSGARNARTGEFTLHEMLLAGESYLKNHPSYRSILGEDWTPNLDTHVLLAACQDHQVAKEKAKREDGRVVGYIGIFTESLIRVLQSSCGVEKPTYVDIIRAAGTSRYQTPVAFGKWKNSPVWHQE
ncbi:caspase domain-containing protein [Armillaria novae-zelandiae]|uniref:Caspase domain-containing protein n=1 Tax=Armillaria novae-zelandiae TaxID=153914 RepID=A0AA39UAN6_9AGAR|nr:caspase domain-containing protein [Armillaria novae-zelandiae]